MSSVCILDYGSGNVKSVFNLFDSIASRVVVSNDPVEIARASHLVLPGVGAFGSTMRKIRDTLPMEILERMVLVERKPFLGICVGMQVLASHGMEFGEHEGLGWIAGSVERLETNGLTLPHIGWNNITCKRASPLMAGLENGADFYFVHSFYFREGDPLEVLASAQYGKEFCSVIQRVNLYGVQFHPEKSQRAGVKLAKNFLSLV
jgi:imidazole glycerol-phosphate synthase subunit HisH